ncbi:MULTISPECIES: DUF2231 domain-containing protein [unclassified Brevundimonas]|uniref:DUF2231 domain-containing protein n=1 Tax=unclassified Brevundimonas TaxID=2622653 RepID=UPI003F91AEBE
MTASLKAEGPLLRPLNALLLSFPIALFSAALATDIAYLRTAEIQWTNFSAWLIVGALVFGGLVLAWALIVLLLGWREPDRRRRVILACGLGLMWILGLINAFKHSQDAWSSVGVFGLSLSIACTLLALGAGFIAYSDHGYRESAG